MNAVMSDPLVLSASFESDEGTTRIYNNGLIESTIKEGAYIDVPYLLIGNSRLKKFGGKKFYVLSESEGFFRISRKARQLLASPEYSRHFSAIAVVTTHLFVKLIAEMYYGIDKPITPTKTFTSREAAMLWLEEKMKEDATQTSAAR